MDETEGAAASAPEPLPATFDGASWRQLAASAIACALLAAAGVYILSGYLHALAWALILAVALWPLYRRFNHRLGAGVSSEVAPLLFTALVGAMILAPLATFAVDAVAELRQLIDYARAEGDTGLPVPDAVERIPYAGAWISQWWRMNLSHAGWARDLLHQINTSTARQIGAAVGANAIHRSMLFAVCLLSLFFLFRNGEIFIAQCRSASFRLFGARGEALAAQMIASVRGTLNGLVLVAIGEGLIMVTAYMLTRTPHAVLLGILTAFAAMIPFAAAFAIGLAAIVAALSVGVTQAIVIAACGTVVVFIADHFVRPKLIGSATKMPFIWVLLGILGGVETFQLLGLFIGPAVMAALISLWRDLSAPPPQPL